MELSPATATATTRTRTRSSFQALHEGERTVTPPDMLYGAFVLEYIAERTLEAVELPIEMRPLSYSYLIRYRFASGQQYVAQARGALAGVADKVYLQDGHTDEVSSTVLFDCKVDDLHLRRQPRHARPAPRRHPAGGGHRGVR